MTETASESPAERPPAAKPPWPRWALGLIAGLVVLFAVVVVRTAWLSEDAYFTYRSVENWVHGYGARWNVNERVQAYTHPLWFALTSALYFVSRDMTFSGFALGFLCTAGAVYVLVRHVGASWQATVLALACVIASKSFTDYSTSGLENPLSHLLLLAFFARFWADEDPDPAVAERRLVVTSAFGGLLVCNRLDLGVVLAPALVYLLWPLHRPLRQTVRRAVAVGLGFAPLILWELISLVYYGFLVPNTAFAKLGASLPRDQVTQQAIYYFENSLKWDPITLLCIAVVAIVSFVQLRERPRHACAAAGVVLYLAYVLYIGGDYMTGRFFSAPFAVAVGLLANRARLPKAWFAVGVVVIAALAFMAPNPTLTSGKDYTKHNLGSVNEIDDERGYRHIFAGLISERESEFLANSSWYRRGKKDRKAAEERGETLVQVNGNGGYMGFAAGPAVHYLNPYGITDPLLARLPGTFRAPGHIRRRLPSGYVRAAIDKGEIRDPNLAAYWSDLALVTRGPIWSRERWAAIWRVNTGANQHLLEAYNREHPLRE